jgi:hypothetical protein
VSRFSKPIRRTRAGAYQVTLPPEQRELLRGLPGQLRELFADPDDPLLRRLFPPAYTDDEKASAEYRRLMTEDLVERNQASLDVLERTANATELSEEELHAWMGALNQLRLVLGTSLDVSEADDPAEATSPQHHLYYFLGALQELVIEALSSS